MTKWQKYWSQYHWNHCAKRVRIRSYSGPYFPAFFIYLFIYFFQRGGKSSCFSFQDFENFQGHIVEIQFLFFKAKRTKVHYPSVQNSLIKIGRIKTRFFQINIYRIRGCNVFLQSYNCSTWLSYFQGLGQTQRLVMPRNYKRIIYDTLVIRLNQKSKTIQDQLNLIPTLES